MSEYQYYEFLAGDRPLTEAEQDEVREFSSRATITATSFVNEYQWGDFRGDPGHLMRHYYDAHLYLANWGTHRIMLRMPCALLDPAVAEKYCVDDQVTASVAGEDLIIDMVSEDEEGDWDPDSDESLAAIIGVRAELAAGTCGRCILPGCRHTGRGSATRKPSTWRTRTCGNLRSRRDLDLLPRRSVRSPTSCGWTLTC